MKQKLKPMTILSCLIVFSTGFFNCALIAEQSISVQMQADGSKFIHDIDGTFVQINSDGSKVIKTNDGSVINVLK